MKPARKPVGHLTLGLLTCCLLAGPALAGEPFSKLAELAEKSWRQVDGLPHDTVYRTHETRDGYLWIGTRDGLARFDGLSFETFGRAELGLERTTRIQALAEDASGDLWIGSDGGELLRYRDGAFRHFDTAAGLAVGRITDLLAVPGGELWIATYADGIHRLKNGVASQLIPQRFPVISRMVGDGAGGLYIATMAGLYHWHEGRLDTYTRQNGLPSERVWSVTPARGGGAWVATQAGLCRLDAGLVVRTYTQADGLRKNHVTAVLESSLGVLFIGTYGGGVHLLPPGGAIEALAAGEAGADDLVWSLAEDRSGSLWSANADSGLRLFAAPATVTAGASPPPRAQITRIELDGKTLAPAAPGVFASGPHRFTFRFAAPLPSAGNKVQMRYRLAGIDRAYGSAGPQREVTYAGLAPGNYRFLAQASSPAGVWLDPPAEYAFTLEAGFFESWRWPLLLLALISLLAFLYHRWQVRELAAREIELARRVEKAVADIRTLQKLLPICGECHQVRDDRGYWQQVETYLGSRPGLALTHGLCPDCAGRLIEEIESGEAELG